MMFRTCKIILSGVSMTVLGGCNHLFYFPDSATHWTPDQLHIPYQDFYFDAQDGTRLHGWHLEGGDKSEGTVLQFHGNAENMTTHFASVAWLAQSGFDVVTFDYRGYGKSAGAPDRSGLVLDGQAVIQWVRSHPKLGRQDLFVLGQSLGGAVAVPALVQSGQQGIGALILDSTFHSYRGIVRDKLGSIWLTWPLQWPLSFLVSDELSPIDSIGEITVPILFMHGLRDPVVSIELGRKLFDAAPSKQKEFWEVQTRGHVSAFAGEATPYKSRFVDYLRKHLRKRRPNS